MLAEIGFIGRTATPVFLTVGQVVSVSSQRKCWGLHLPVIPFHRTWRQLFMELSVLTV